LRKAEEGRQVEEGRGRQRKAEEDRRRQAEEGMQVEEGRGRQRKASRQAGRGRQAC
jgi:hypothetical protein